MTNPCPEIVRLQNLNDYLTKEHVKMANEISLLWQENYELKLRLGDERQMEITG